MIPCHVHLLAAMYEGLIRRRAKRSNTESSMLGKACAAVGARPATVVSHRKDRKATEQRCAVWRFLRNLDPLRWSYPEIGRLTGHDHTSVMSGVRGGKSKKRSTALMGAGT